MNKRATLKLYEGTVTEGFSVILQMGDEGKSPALELSARLPPAPELAAQFQHWQAAYRQQDSLCSPSRIIAVETGLPKNVAIAQDCNSASEKLGALLNEWLRSAPFRPIRDKLLERLNPNETTQLVLQTQDTVVQRLPWHLWEVCSLYSSLEVALSAPVYDSAVRPDVVKRDRVRILAIFGNHAGLDTQTDRTLLKALPNAEIHYLQEPDRAALDACIWDEQGWDILFFAGHSATHEGVGEISINATDTITIPQLKHALRKAVSRGLKIAIFNSCDGLGLAKSLSDLKLSQIVVMREVVSDKVAHTFLKYFLESFSRGEPLYLAVREAREKLLGLESQFPCASWLPTIYQNPAEISPSWRSLYAQRSENLADKRKQTLRRRLPFLLLTQAGVAIALFALQSLGFFQGLELKMYDQLMRSRSKETPDPRIVVVEVTEEDVRSQPGTEEKRGSLSDQALSAALTQLSLLEPRLIGLDIYRDFAVREDQPALETMLKEMNNLFVVCKSSDDSADEGGLPPPPEVPSARVGFSDSVKDSDGILRRQLLGFTPAASSPCQSGYNLSALLALGYLAQEDINLQTIDQNTLQLGEARIDLLGENDGGYQGIDNNGSQLLLNYRSLERPADIAESVTLAELLAGDVRAEAIRDRIILIGTTANSFRDSEPTPYSRGRGDEMQTKGVFLQAQMVSQLLSAALDGRLLLRTLPQWGETLWVLMWVGAGGLVAFGLARTKNASGRMWLALLCTELGLLGLCWLLFTKASYWVPWVPVAIAPVAVVVADKFVVDKIIENKRVEREKIG